MYLFIAGAGRTNQTKNTTSMQVERANALFNASFFGKKRTFTTLIPLKVDRINSTQYIGMFSVWLPFDELVTIM